jgi:uncharacterized caspase-like protein
MTLLKAIGSAGLLILAASLVGLGSAQARVAKVGPLSVQPLDSTNTAPIRSAAKTRGSPTIVAQNGAGPAPRVALVIGNATYPDDVVALTHPIEDARSIAAELRRFDFDVVTGEDLSRQRLRAAIDSFKAKIKPGSAALLFFSGHAIQSARQSYLLPVNANIWTEAEIRRDGVSLESIMAAMRDAGASVRLVIIDASRRNPFEERFRASPAGLAPLSITAGSAVLYSMEPDKVIREIDGRNSLFMSELLKGLRTPGLSVGTIFNNTRLSVSRASRYEQVPWVSSALVEEFRFTRPAGERVSTAPTERRDQSAKPSTSLSADEQLIQDYDEAIARNPRDPDAYYRRGQIYARQHQFSRAIEDFSETIRLRPQDAQAFNNRCWTRAVAGYLEAALTDCNEALRLRASFADAYDSRGLVYLKLGRWDRAIADYDAALRANPKLASAMYGRGQAKLKKGDVAGGNADLRAATRLDPGIEEEFADYDVP